MYTEYFQLTQLPFSLSPDPRYIYLSDKHREALAHLTYGLGEGGQGEAGGFVQLTGEVGTGKTTVCRTLLDRLPEPVDVALIFNPVPSARELLEAVCDELRIAVAPGTHEKGLMDAIYERLLESNAAGRRTVLILDEAQNLSAEVLERLRLLTNLETDSAKLLQIFLIGQPELRDMLGSRELRQIAQRITARYHLEALDKHDTALYLAHRLRIAGVTRSLFSKSAQRAIYRLSGGVPRLINILADRSLLGAYVDEVDLVTPRIVRRAHREVTGSGPGNRWSRLRRVTPGGLAVGVGVGGMLALGLTALMWNSPLPTNWAGSAESADFEKLLLTPRNPTPRVLPDRHQANLAVAKPQPQTAAPSDEVQAVWGDPGPTEMSSNPVLPPPTTTALASRPGAVRDERRLGVSKTKLSTENPVPAQVSSTQATPLIGPSGGPSGASSGGSSGGSGGGLLVSSATGAAMAPDRSPSMSAVPASQRAPTPGTKHVPNLDTAELVQHKMRPTFEELTSLPDDGFAARALLERWSALDVDPTAPLCVQARRRALHCLEGTAAFEVLARIGLPFLVSTVPIGGLSKEVLVEQVRGDSAQVMYEGARSQFEKATLAPRLSGRYRVVWRGPRGYRSQDEDGEIQVLRQGDRGAGVQWIRKRLSYFDGKSGRGDSFGPITATRLRRFQGERGIQVDGIAGPETLMHLSALNDGGQ